MTTISTTGYSGKVDHHETQVIIPMEDHDAHIECSLDGLETLDKTTSKIPYYFATHGAQDMRTVGKARVKKSIEGQI